MAYNVSPPATLAYLPPLGHGASPLIPEDLLLTHVLTGVARAMLGKIQVRMHKSRLLPLFFFFSIPQSSAQDISLLRMCPCEQ